jgi:hypothetical protein
LNETVVRTLAGVASGLIDLQDFYGKSNLSATLPASMTGNDFAISTADANVYLYINSDGTWSMTGGGSGTWKNGGTGSDYQVRMTLSTGTMSFGTLGTWTTISANQTWRVSETRNGFYETAFTGTLEIRLAAAPNTVLDSCSVSMTATVEI